ncbi:MAG: sugar ABC transporter substrate-binding protein [Defluviicoccus sp.]|nr:sugar ABC transporter substrate-binding protein [Defluviicoccus sp.]
MNSRRRFLTAFVLGLAALFTIASCKDAEHARVLLLLKTLDNPFFKDIEHGFRDHWRSEIKVDVLAGRSESDAPAQREILETYIRNYVKNRDQPLLKGVALSPSDSGDGLVPAIAELRRAGIPVLLVDTGISLAALQRGNTTFSLLLESDNVLGGRLAGEVLITALRGKQMSRVLLLNGAPEQETARARRKGFLEAVSSANFEITERAGNWRRSEARTIVEAFRHVAQLPDAIFAANDEMAIGAVEALGGHADRLPFIVGFDATKEGREFVRTGLMHATIAQSPKRMGQRAAEQLASMITNGEPFSMRTEFIPVEVITRDQQ